MFCSYSNSFLYTAEFIIFCYCFLYDGLYIDLRMNDFSTDDGVGMNWWDFRGWSDAGCRVCRCNSDGTFF